jgi:hypothetical protein
VDGYCPVNVARTRLYSRPYTDALRFAKAARLRGRTTPQPVVAYNIITSNLEYGIPGQGAAIGLTSGYGPEVVAFNQVTNNRVTETANCQLMETSSISGARMVNAA